MGHTDWGADHIVLLCLYLALAHSKLDYGCTVYESACQLALEQLDLIHHQGLCIMSGAFCASPAQSLYVEACKPSLASHCLKLALNYVLKPKSLPKNPTYSCIFESENIKLFQESEQTIPPLSINILFHLEKSKVSQSGLAVRC